MNRRIIILVFAFACIFALSYIDNMSIEQATDGSGFVRICYTAYSTHDTIISVNVLGTLASDPSVRFPVITMLDTVTGYDRPNYGWRVSASDTGEAHCFIWDMTSDVGDIEQCEIIGQFIVYDSILSSYELADSFMANPPDRPTVRSWGLAYRHGDLWVMYHESGSGHCWIRPYTLPDLVEGDSIFIGTVTVGPSDMTFVGNRLFWIEDTRMILKEFDFETGVSHAVRSDWWSLPGTHRNLAGATFDGQHLWVCFSLGTFIALDTADFSLVDTMFFPEFAVSVPATCADGLAHALGLLFCYSNDNIIYAIDPEMKEIVYTIPTGDVVDITGAEGATWDGENLWVADFARHHVYKISIYEMINYYHSSPFCLDNQPPRLTWHSPSHMDYADTMIAGASYELHWSAVDSFLNGGETTIKLWSDTVATTSASDTSVMWSVYDWVDYEGYFNLTVVDSFGNRATLPSGIFYIAENRAPVFYVCPPDTVLRLGDSLYAGFFVFDAEDDPLTFTLDAPVDAFIEDDFVVWEVSGEPGETVSFTIYVCDLYKCDTCHFEITIAPNEPPEFVICPDDFTARVEESLSIPFLAIDHEGDDIEYTYLLPEGADAIGDSLITLPSVIGEVGDILEFMLVACDEIGCDTCRFFAEIVENMPPEFVLCPEDTISFYDTTTSHIVYFRAIDPDGDPLFYSIETRAEAYFISDTSIAYIPRGISFDTVRIIASDLALADTCLFYIQNFHAIDEDFERLQGREIIKTYPNPFNSTIAISSDIANYYEIYDLMGNLIDRLHNYASGEVIWHAPDGLHSGMYIIKAFMDDEIAGTKYIVYMK